MSDFKQYQSNSRAVNIEFPEKVDTFFINEVEDSTLLKLIHHFKSNLTDSVEIATLNQYIQSYGYPLWEKAFHTRLNDGFLYAIPVAKDGAKIETIWFFKVTDKKLHSFSTNRKTLSSFDWMYDYFTSSLYYAPNELKVKVKRAPHSRSVQCNDIYTGYIDQYGNEHMEYSYTYCWDNGFGGGDYVYEDDREGGNGNKEDIDYEVAPPPDEGGGGYVEQDNKLSISQIVNDENFKAQKATAVNKMKADLKEGRRELGFWIFQDSKDGKLHIGELKKGELVKGTGRASMTPGSSSPANNGSHIPTTATAVAFFHVHTAMTNIEEGHKRKVGLSDGDRKYAKENNIIMIVEDYVGTSTNSGYNIITSGHNKDAQMKTYTYKP